MIGSLEGRLGLRMAHGDLTDDQAYLPQRMNLSDRRFAITTQFSAHASTTALSVEAPEVDLLSGSKAEAGECHRGGSLGDSPQEIVPAGTAGHRSALGG